MDLETYFTVVAGASTALAMYRGFPSFAQSISRMFNSPPKPNPGTSVIEGEVKQVSTQQRYMGNTTRVLLDTNEGEVLLTASPAYVEKYSKLEGVLSGVVSPGDNISLISRPKEDIGQMKHYTIFSPNLKIEKNGESRLIINRGI
jgi:hypothetical protein